MRKTLRVITRAVVGTLRRGVRALLYGAVGGVLVLVVGFVMVLERRPDLEVWHEADLDAEFTTDSPERRFEDYLALEERLFAQLEKRVYDQVPTSAGQGINRYSRGSLSDPGRWPANWNRSFELSAPTPAFGVLLVHGMSESPYSLRALGQRLHREGGWVVGLRVPGHGTAPVGLTRVAWEDMAAAVELAVEHLREKVGERPLYIVGYSNGGALAVLHALAALDDGSLARVHGLVLISAAIGVTRLAALASWQERLGRVLGFSKLCWNSILPEYDPYKYGSFALNAAKQTRRLTMEIQNRISELGSTGSLERFPPLLAFQSVVDATVSAPALVTDLFGRLPPGPHELVLFDINRLVAVETFLKANPSVWIDAVLRSREQRFSVDLVTNENAKTGWVVSRRYVPGDEEPTETRLGLRWPANVYSLSHVALPFPPDDPLYGGPAAAASPGVRLGSLAFRGERGTLRVSAAEMLRIRWNPFYAYLEQRILDFVR